MNNNRKNFKKQLNIIIPLLGFLGFIGLWQIIAGFYDTFILPAPTEVFQRYLVFWREHNSLSTHFITTFTEAFGGFLLATLFALPLSYLMYRHPVLDHLLTPFVVGIQTVPTVAIAPLLVIWFGFGLTSKVLLGALIAFFPIVTNGVVGLKETDPRLRELLRIMGADSKTIFFKLEVPSSLPILFSGLKVGLTLSVIGAVVGEFSGSGKGLGYMVNLAKGTFDTPLIFIALVALVILGFIFYAALSILERLLMPWKKQTGRGA